MHCSLAWVHCKNLFQPLSQGSKKAPIDASRGFHFRLPGTQLLTPYGAMRARIRQYHSSLIILFAYPPTLCPTINCVLFVALILPRHALFATSISAAIIFIAAWTVTTSIAAAVLTTTAPTATGLIPIPPPN